MLKVYRMIFFFIDPPPLPQKEYVLYTWLNVDNYGYWIRVYYMLQIAAAKALSNMESIKDIIC